MWSHCRDALRSLNRDRGFTALALLLLAMTMGSTIAIFAVVDAVLLRPMAFAEPDRTVVVWQRDTPRNTPVVELAHGEVETWRERSSVFDDLAVFGSVNWPLTVGDGDARTRVPYAAVSATFFSVVGIPPAMGRVLGAGDETGNVPRVALISDAFWREYFAGDPAVIGRSIRARDLNVFPTESGSLEIVGVMPAAFDFPRGARIWLPAAPIIRATARPNPTDPADVAWYLANFRVFYAIGRLRDHVSAIAAEQELGGIIRETAGASPAGAASQAVVTAVDDYLLGPTKPVLWVMLAGAALMLVLACSSVSGLHLFRAVRQDRALAIQLALGASRSRLIRRSLMESALVGAIGAVGAAGVAWMITQLLVARAPFDVPRLEAARVDTPTVLPAMAGLALITSALSAVWPALFITRVDAGRTLTSGARTAMDPRERLLQRFVVGWQVVVAVVVLAGAALFVRSVANLDRTMLGFNPAGLLAVEVEPAAKDQARWDQFYDTLMERAGQLPGVAGAGAVYSRPLSGPIGNDTIPVLEGQAGLGPDAAWRANPRANLEAVTPGYFRTMGTRLLSGRDFTADDRADTPNVVIVSRSAAARYWPGRNPVGEPILVPTQRAPGSLENPRWQTVVGVVEDVRYRGLTDPRLDVYLPAAQSTLQVKHLLIRTIAEPELLTTSVRALVRSLDPGALVGEIVTMSDVVARETAPWRFAMRALSGFGALAAVLAMVGLMGLVTLLVALQRRELGIRAALGATPGRLRAHVLTEALWIIAAATLLGLVLASAVGRLVQGLLVQTPPHDPVALVGAAVLTSVAGLLGCLLSARRVGATDPTEALRE